MKTNVMSEYIEIVQHAKKHHMFCEMLSHEKYDTAEIVMMLKVRGKVRKCQGKKKYVWNEISETS